MLLYEESAVKNLGTKSKIPSFGGLPKMGNTETYCKEEWDMLRGSFPVREDCVSEQNKNDELESQNGDKI